MNTFYVSSVKVQRGGRKSPRWSFGIGIDTERPSDSSLIPGYHQAVYEVDCTNKSEAAGVVFHWLSRGRPSAMTVRQIWPREETG